MIVMLSGIALVLSTLTPQAPAAPPAAAPAVQARQADVATIDGILGALYASISGPAGQQRDWDRLRSLFSEGGRLMPTAVRADGSRLFRVWTVEEYITNAGPGLEKSGFFEREIGRTTDTFGQIAHVFSAYDSKRTEADPQPFQRGINSIQLRHDGTRWWIVTVFWDSERPDNPIPPKYLKGGGL